MKPAELALYLGLGVAGAVLAGLIARPVHQAADAIDEGAPFEPDALPPSEDADQLPNLAESAVLFAMNPFSSWSSSSTSTDQEAANLRAFLDLIAYAEGTANYPDSGYLTMFGGRQALSYADHPRQVFPFMNKRGEQLRTSAAGRYQFLARTWDELARKLGLQDFSPASQDAACIELIRQRGALADVKAGRVVDAVAKCAKTWASLPGAGYAQPERKLSSLVAAFEAAGGITTT